MGWGLGEGLWLLRGSGVRDTLRMSLLLCGGDCCRRWLDGDMLEVKRPWGLPRLRFADNGERRLEDGTGERTSLPGREEDSMGLLLCLDGDVEGGGVRLLGAGELLRLGDLEGRRLVTGEERFEGELDTFLFCGGRGEGL